MLKELTYSEHTKTVILAIICRVFYVLVGMSSIDFDRIETRVQRAGLMILLSNLV